MISDNEKKDELSSEEVPDTVKPQPPPPAAVYHMDGHEMRCMEDEEDLMPDPAQLMAIMSAAPPPPPRMPILVQEEVLPPGIDEADADLVPKPISDAPRPRKGPLPKDFQDALNIIFPGEKKPDSDVPTAPVEEPKKESTDILLEQQMVMSDELSQQSLDVYGVYAAAAAAGVSFSGTAQMYGIYEPSAQENIPTEIIAPPPPPPPIFLETNGSDKSPEMKTVEMEDVVPDEPDTAARDELDDLAMLGIDADDMAAQCM